MVSVAVTGPLYALYVLGALGRRTRFQTSDLAQLVLNVTVSDDVTVGGAGQAEHSAAPPQNGPEPIKFPTVLLALVLHMKDCVGATCSPDRKREGYICPLSPCYVHTHTCAHTHTHTTHTHHTHTHTPPHTHAHTHTHTQDVSLNDDTVLDHIQFAGGTPQTAPITPLQQAVLLCRW